jgi:hypothetical protein
MLRRAKPKLTRESLDQPIESTPVPGEQDALPPVPGRVNRAVSIGGLRSAAIGKFRGLARSTGLPNEVTDVLAEAVDDLGHTTLRTRSINGARAGASTAANRSLEAMVGLCSRELIQIENLSQLDDWMDRVRKTLNRAEKLVQIWLAGAGILAAAPTDTMSIGAALGLDLILGQVISLLLGLSEWFVVGTYAAWLLRQEGIEPEPQALRLIVDCTLLTRGGKPVKPEDIRSRAEARLVVRWFRLGVMDAIPGLSLLGGRSIHHAGLTLERSDLAVLAALASAGSSD